MVDFPVIFDWTIKEKLFVVPAGLIGWKITIEISQMGIYIESTGSGLSDLRTIPTQKK